MDPKAMQLPSSSELLAGVRLKERERPVAEQDEDLERCLKLADELVRHYKRRKAELADNAMERFPRPPNRQEAVDRDEGALADLRAERARTKQLQ